MTPDEIAAEMAAVDSLRQSEAVMQSPNLISPEEMEADYAKFQQEQKYGNRPGAATAAALASGLTFSLSDRVLDATGLVDKETLAGLAEHNPEADIVGQVSGALLPALVTGGASTGASAAATGARAGLKTALRATAPALAERAALQVEKKIASALASAAAESGNKKLVQEIIKKSVAKGAGSAVEGAAWGANQLLREDALGKAELNAENLLSYAGEGALVGGTLGAALVPGGVLMREAGSGLSKALKKAGSQVFDPVRDSAKLMDLTPAQIAKFESKNPKFLEGLPDFLRNKVGLKWNDSADSLVTKLDGLQESAVTRIDDAIQQLDNQMASKGTGIGPGVYNDVAVELEKRFVEPYKGMKSMESYAAKAKELAEDFRTKANDTRLELRRLSFNEIRDMRKKMDQMAKAFYKSTDPSEGAKAAFAARDTLKSVISKYADSVDPTIAQKLADANLDYHYAATLGPRLSTKAEKQKDFVSFKDLLLGGVGAGLGGEVGLTLAAANKFLHSDLKRKMVILSQVEKAAQKTASRTSEALSNFFTKGSKASKLLSTGVLVRSSLAQKDGDKEAPKNRVEAFRNIQNNVVELAADPQKMQNRILKSTHILAQAAPDTARSMGETMGRATQFLARKAPKDARDIGFPVYEPKYEPSSVELSKFERYVQVIDAPLSVLKDLEQGTLTRDHVEALKAVYPNLYQEIRVEALKQAETTPSLSYNKRIQLGILLDIPTDSSLSPQFILQMQQNFVPPEERQNQMQANGVPSQGAAVQPTMSGAAKMDGAQRQQTDTQRVASRGSQG